MPKIDAREEKRVRGKERAKNISSEKESKTCVAVFVFLSISCFKMQLESKRSHNFLLHTQKVSTGAVNFAYLHMKVSKQACQPEEIIHKDVLG